VARECYFAKRFVCPQIHVFGLAKFLIDFDIERVLKASTLKQDVGWSTTMHDLFFLRLYTMRELHNQNISIG